MKKIFIQNADGTFIKKYRCPSCKELFDEEFEREFQKIERNRPVKEEREVEEREEVAGHSLLHN